MSAKMEGQQPIRWKGIVQYLEPYFLGTKHLTELGQIIVGYNNSEII